MSDAEEHTPKKNNGNSCWKRPTIVVKLLWLGLSIAALVVDLIYFLRINNGFYQHYLSLYSGTILLCSVAFAAVGCVLLILLMLEVQCIVDRKPAALICSVLEGLVSFGLAAYFCYGFGRPTVRNELEDDVIKTYLDVVWEGDNTPETNGYLLWFMQHEMVGYDIDNTDVWLERVHSWASSVTTSIALIVLILMSVYAAFNIVIIAILAREPDKPEPEPAEPSLD